MVFNFSLSKIRPQEIIVKDITLLSININIHSDFIKTIK